MEQFQRSAGVFAFLSSDPALALVRSQHNNGSYVKKNWTADLGVTSLQFLHKLMLAQAQTCLFEKAAGIAKVCFLFIELHCFAAVDCIATTHR